MAEWYVCEKCGACVALDAETLHDSDMLDVMVIGGRDHVYCRPCMERLLAHEDIHRDRFWTPSRRAALKTVQHALAPRPAKMRRRR